MLQIVDKLFALYGVEKDYFWGGKNRGLNNGRNGEKLFLVAYFKNCQIRGGLQICFTVMLCINVLDSVTESQRVVDGK